MGNVLLQVTETFSTSLSTRGSWLAHVTNLRTRARIWSPWIQLQTSHLCFLFYFVFLGKKQWLLQMAEDMATGSSRTYPNHSITSRESQFFSSGLDDPRGMTRWFLLTHYIPQAHPYGQRNMRYCTWSSSGHVPTAPVARVGQVCSQVKSLTGRSSTNINSLLNSFPFFPK